MKTEITQIKIKLSKDREILLSAEEARKLHEELGVLFDVEKRTVIDELKKLMPAKEYVPYPVYPAPIVIQQQPWWRPHWQWPQITCGAGTGLGGYTTSGGTSLHCISLT